MMWREAYPKVPSAFAFSALSTTSSTAKRLRITPTSRGISEVVKTVMRIPMTSWADSKSR